MKDCWLLLALQARNSKPTQAYRPPLLKQIYHTCVVCRLAEDV